VPHAIVARGLGKRFYRYHQDRPTTIRDALLRGLRWMRPKEVFWGLREVSFEIEAGSMVGVIGANGAGKSTLLRLVGGIQRPDEGSVEVHGRVGGFLDLKAGFRPDLTGRENVFIGGIIAGLLRREVAQRFDAIVAFAELEDFIDNPVYTYSTGMQMRLAFGIAAHTEPEILLIDEVLAVGDLAFRRKCFDQIEKFRRGGCTILLVTHETAQVQRLCDQALWLRGGRLCAFGDPSEIVKQYLAELDRATRQRTPGDGAAGAQESARLRLNENRFGSQEMEIVGVRLLDPSGSAVAEFHSGTPLNIEVEYHAPRPIRAPIFGVGISQGHQKVCSLTTAADGVSFPTLQGRGRLSLWIESLDLAGGDYFLDVGVYRHDWEYAYDYHWHAYPFTVQPTSVKKGFWLPPHRWELAQEQRPAGSSAPVREVWSQESE
jgi:lipopolysaccharide transport system ATP-binding protein